MSHPYRAPLGALSSLSLARCSVRALPALCVPLAASALWIAPDICCASIMGRDPRLTARAARLAAMQEIRHGRPGIEEEGTVRLMRRASRTAHPQA